MENKLGAQRIRKKKGVEKEKKAENYFKGYLSMPQIILTLYILYMNFIYNKD